MITRSNAHLPPALESVEAAAQLWMAVWNAGMRSFTILHAATRVTVSGCSSLVSPNKRVLPE